MKSLLIENKRKGLPITSVDLTLAEIVQKKMSFNVPIYQRLYVWGDQQIRTLLEDIDRAFSEKPESTYYLGGIMLTPHKNSGNIFDLIDGQQRFTTLWLISQFLNLPPLKDFAYISKGEEKTPRMTFSVREHANNYFKIGQRPPGLTKSEIEELDPIENGFDIIKGYLQNHKDKNGLANFISKNVLFVATQVPEDVDENKIFEAMNNRGVQLEQHQILKSKLLSKIKNDPELRHKYSLIWDACSIMDDYLEKNIKSVANLPWKDLFPEKTNEEGENRLPKNIIDRIGSGDSNTGKEKNLFSILNNSALTDEEEKELKSKEQNDYKDYDSGKVASIITFPMLLLHTLRIYQYRFKEITDPEQSVAVKEKELISIFEEKDKEGYFNSSEDNSSVTAFFDLLWRVREKFDEFIIKWSFLEDDDNEKIHLIKKLSQNETAFQRSAPKSTDKFSLLQGMLYHSQQIITHYWLTPFLNKMLEINNKQDLYEYLVKLDNTMFCRSRKDGQDLRKLSYQILFYKDEDLTGDAFYVGQELRAQRGTKYPSYWFYKTEYILWVNKENLGKSEKWENFRITAKNSVEHISPQNPKEYDHNKVWDEYDSEEEKRRKLDDFGNLVLLSSGMNSEYSNKTFNSKRTDYNDLKRFEPLKSDLIFDNETWNWEKCESHREYIIDLFKDYLKK